ncbi:carboxylesterase [Infundibulicybe gibba]|nr:carboxylesterase [Infundibulicybe gibba]
MESRNVLPQTASCLWPHESLGWKLNTNAEAAESSISPAMENPHLHDEMLRTDTRVLVTTNYGPVVGGRAANGAAAFLEIPYALPPKRFEDPVPLPPDFKYEMREYISETKYAAQPTNDGQAGNTPFEDKVGRGTASENPLFLNIVSPPSFPSAERYPVKVYIHGGFLQFGSPHSLSSQAQYVSAYRSEVWVNIGYRLSAFGFLASGKYNLRGNYGFKDQWLALEWIRDNIEAFGGNPNDIQVTGLSAGAHALHQILHYASRLPQGERAPFHSAILQSNGILTNPKTPAELQPQFDALCRALGLDPDNPGALAALRDPDQISWQSITKVIETDALGTKYGTFRGCLDGVWMASLPDPMAWQHSGGFANGLLAVGVKSIILGDLTEEWYSYSMAHPIKAPQDIAPNLERYFSHETAQKLIDNFPALPKNASPEQAQELFGEILSAAQVHLPVRLLARDLSAAGFPVTRYQIRWTPEQNRTKGYVTHGTDRAIWALRVPMLEPDQIIYAKSWVARIKEEVESLEMSGRTPRDPRVTLTLLEDKSIGWMKDDKWETSIRLCERLEEKNSKL